MSEKHARAVRRDLRRAIGDDALGILQSHVLAHNNQVIPNINALLSNDAALDQRMTRLEERFQAFVDALATKL